LERKSFFVIKKNTKVHSLLFTLYHAVLFSQGVVGQFTPKW